ncbi:MarR family winged helix-turn-helix transcriptional regulator [Streptomyces sp. NPDC003236]|uniref:MarR family winged helix-turn-helix transcriptional regulator n=1 Tax=Streptomyces TaxID=1883 RepID=UPI0013CE984D|nr:MarR family transcriptional regulator [Streptomyces sp. Tu 4128]
MDEILGPRQGLLLRRLDGSGRAEFAMGLLATARRIDDAYNDLLVGHDLSGGRFAALLAVSEAPGITPARLSEELEVKRATVTGLIDGLVKRGFVVRGSAEADRRVQTLTITSAGEHRVQQILPLVDQWLERLVSGIEGPDRDTAWLLLSRIHRNIDTRADD